MPLVAIRAKGNVEDVAAALKVAEGLAQRHQVFLQLVDPKVVYNERHILSAHFHAARATKEGRSTANSLGAEFLLYLTGQRQVANALTLAGIKAGAEATIVVAEGDRAGTVIWGLLDKLGWSRDSAGLGTNPSALSALGIPVGLHGRPEEAILERVALLDVQK